MVLDIISLIVLILFFIRGYTRGAIVAIFSVLAILLGILCALKLSQSLSAWLLENGYVTSGWVTVISYVALFIGVIILVNFIGKLLQKALENLFLGTVNRLIGGLLYLILGLIFWSSLLWIGTKSGIITPALIAGSRTYSWLTHIAPWFFVQAGKLLPFVKDTFEKLNHFFDTINQKSPGHVGAHR